MIIGAKWRSKATGRFLSDRAARELKARFTAARHLMARVKYPPQPKPPRFVKPTLPYAPRGPAVRWRYKGRFITTATARRLRNLRHVTGRVIMVPVKPLPLTPLPTPPKPLPPERAPIRHPGYPPKKQKPPLKSWWDEAYEELADAEFEEWEIEKMFEYWRSLSLGREEARAELEWTLDMGPEMLRGKAEFDAAVGPAESILIIKRYQRPAPPGVLGRKKRKPGSMRLVRLYLHLQRPATEEEIGAYGYYRNIFNAMSWQERRTNNIVHTIDLMPADSPLRQVSLYGDTEQAPRFDETFTQQTDISLDDPDADDVMQAIIGNMIARHFQARYHQTLSVTGEFYDPQSPETITKTIIGRRWTGGS